MDVLVFKTNLTQSTIAQLSDVLTSLVGLIRWTVDLEDCDRVLRLEADHMHPQSVIDQLKQAEIMCEELL